MLMQTAYIPHCTGSYWSKRAYEVLLQVQAGKVFVSSCTSNTYLLPKRHIKSGVHRAMGGFVSGEPTLRSQQSLTAVIILWQIYLVLVRTSTCAGGPLEHYLLLLNLKPTAAQHAGLFQLLCAVFHSAQPVNYHSPLDPENSLLEK